MSGIKYDKARWGRNKENNVVSAAGGKQEIKKQRTFTTEGLPVGKLGNNNIPTSTKFKRVTIQTDEAPGM